LEKVRSRSLAMHKSAEIMEVATTVFEKMTDLGVNMSGGVSIVTFFCDSKDLLHWLLLNGMMINAHLPYFDHIIFNECANAREQGLDFFTNTYTGEVKASYLRHILKESGFSKGPEEIKKWVQDQTWFGFSFAIQRNSGIFLNDYTGKLFSDETNDILKRFSRVFEQAYVRFLDLQKAEAQAREAQIEASLERVRSKAMAMQKSEDLANAVAIVFEELDKLNLGMLRCGIGILGKEKCSAKVWTTTKSESGNAVQVAGDEPMNIHPLLQGAFDAWMAQEEEYSYVLEGEDISRFYKAVAGTNFQLPDSQSIKSGTKELKQYYFVAIFQSGGLYAF
jgi:hypothetical protein